MRWLMETTFHLVFQNPKTINIYVYNASSVGFVYCASHWWNNKNRSKVFTFHPFKVNHDFTIKLYLDLKSFHVFFGAIPKMNLKRNLNNSPSNVIQCFFRRAMPILHHKNYRLFQKRNIYRTTRRPMRCDHYELKPHLIRLWYTQSNKIYQGGAPIIIIIIGDRRLPAAFARVREKI